MPLTGTQKTNLAAAETAIATLVTSLAGANNNPKDADQQAILIQYRRTQKYGEKFKSNKDK